MVTGIMTAHVLADAAPASTAAHAMDNTYGALLLGTVFGLMLYGLTVHQTVKYFRLYPTDIIILRCLVFAILGLETLHTVLTIAACYYRLIIKFADPSALVVGHWATRVLTPTAGITIFLCQSFYARRVWLVGRNCRYLVYIAVLCMFALIGFMIVATVEGFILDLREFSDKSWMMSAMFGFAALVDVLLTGTLTAVLLRSRTGLKQTDSVIETLAMYTVNTGLLTGVFAFLSFIFAIVYPKNYIYIGVSIVGTKIYSNSVLAVLNSRRALSNRLLGGSDGMPSPYYRRDARRGPHTAIETWDVPQFAVMLPHSATTHISFTRPMEGDEMGMEMETDVEVDLSDDIPSHGPATKPQIDGTDKEDRDLDVPV